MHHSLDLSILDSGDSAFAIALARAGSDLAIARLPCEVITRLQAFRDRLDRFVRSAAAPLSVKELETYGRDLFDFAIRDDVRRLYERLPAADVRIHLLSDRPDLQSLPWEFLTEPGRAGVPRIDRSIVRVVPTVGVTPPPPRAFSAMTRVLFASADPADQGQVSWSHVKASLEGEFAAQVPEKFTVTAVDGTTKDLLSRALQTDAFDIFHFSGHGEVIGGEGYLALVNRSGKTSHLSVKQLLALLGGRDIRLVVLSACNTAAGNFAEDFSVFAHALVKQGIPAVVANQLPVQNNTVAVFVGALYHELLQSGDIDRAVGAGRVRLYGVLEVAPGSTRATPEWGIPTLYRHFGSAQLFTP